MILRQIERIRWATRIEELVLATSDDPSDDELAAAATRAGVRVFRGSLQDVLDRFYRAALPFRPTHVVRLTGDCPLADPHVIDQTIRTHLEQGNDYTSNCVPVATFPDGLDVEVARFSALERAWKEATKAPEREHVMPFLWGQPARFQIGAVKQDRDLSHLRWTVDEPKDFELVSQIYGELYPRDPAFTTQDILALLERRPELKTLNANIERNEGLKMSFRKDELVQRYKKSEELLERALKTVPLGTQTFSKSYVHYPRGVSPYFITKAKGSRCWDVDGNEFIDFGNALCSVTLGHCDEDVSRAVRAQLDDGVIFPLAHPLEFEVAETIRDLVPSAEMVRFGKNGSDATAGAIRVARAYTKRDHVAVCGYHGWQDWYIGSTARNLGVPQATRDLTHTWMYNDIESLRKLFKEHPGGIAAVIMEPMNVFSPKPGFLESVKELAHQNGAVLIFDEIITGFRYANGGAQELFGVKPDLTTLGKGMANGYPVSAVAGKAEIMRLMEEVFFSFTFGGEALSLAASLATMKKLTREPVVKTMYARGEKLVAGVRAAIARHGLEQVLAVEGNPTWSFLMIKDTPKYTSFQLKTLYLQEVFARGMLTIGTHNMSYAHSEADVARVLAIYDEVFPQLKDVVENGNLERRLHCKPLEPLFKVR